MSAESVEPSGVIQILLPGLRGTPGWKGLTYQKQHEIVERTSHIQQYRQMQRLGKFGELLELAQVELLLEDEEMKMLDYLRVLYPEHSLRTTYRKRDAYQELSANIPPQILERITALGEAVLPRWPRISAAAIGDIRNAIREMMFLPVSTNGNAEQYLEVLNGKLLEERKDRNAKGRAEKDEKQAIERATNAVVDCIRACGLKSTKEKRRLFKLMLGYAMEAEAVPGTLSVGGIPIPAGIRIRRVPPRKAQPAGAA